VEERGWREYSPRPKKEYSSKGLNHQAKHLKARPSTIWGGIIWPTNVGSSATLDTAMGRWPYGL
jgi:hypothetical protein